MVYIGELCVEYLLKPLFTPIQAGVPCKWVHDSQCFLLEFFNTVHNSPSQIYHSALLLSPSSSWIHKCYSTELSQGVKVVKGLSAGWGMWSRTVGLGKNPLALACWKDTVAVGLGGTYDIITLDAITGSQMAIHSGHTGLARALAFSSDGASLVSGSDDKTIKLWDVQTGGVIKTFHGHTHWVLAVSISSSCTIIASGSPDNTIRLWDVQTGECCHIISQPEQITYVNFSPTNSKHLISITGDIIQWWDIDGHQVGPTYKGTHATFSSDGTHLVLCREKGPTVQNYDSGLIVVEFPTVSNFDEWCFSPNGRLVAAAAGPTAYVWDITGSDPHLIKTFIGHTESILSLNFSSSSLISSSWDQTVKFWQIDASSTDPVASDPKPTPSVSAPIESVNLQAVDGIAISSDFDGIVKIWDISTGLCKASFQTPATGELLRDVQMRDDRLVVVQLGDEGVHIWDTKKGELQVVDVYWEGTRDLRISVDGSKFFLLMGRFIQAWSMQTGERQGEVALEEEDESYLDLLHMDGSRICLLSPNSSIQGWDFGISGSSPVPLSDISSERPYLDFVGGASWGYRGSSWIKDTVTGKEVFQLSGRYAKPTNAQWDGRYLIAGYGSGELLILDFIQMIPQ
jgi:WD40 repeat protein